MKNGYKINWTDNALNELNKTIEYLEENFTDKELQKLARKIESTIQLISLNPYLFQQSEKQKICKVPILKFNTLYYQIIIK